MKGELEILFLLLPFEIDLTFKRKIFERYKLNLNKKNIIIIHDKNNEKNVHFYVSIMILSIDQTVYIMTWVTYLGHALG